jgi:hypothetical protein
MFTFFPRHGRSFSLSKHNNSSGLGQAIMGLQQFYYVPLVSGNFAVENINFRHIFTSFTSYKPNYDHFTKPNPNPSKMSNA